MPVHLRFTETAGRLQRHGWRHARHTGILSIQPMAADAVVREIPFAIGARGGVVRKWILLRFAVNEGVVLGFCHYHRLHLAWRACLTAAKLDDNHVATQTQITEQPIFTPRRAA